MAAFAWPTVLGRLSARGDLGEDEAGAALASIMEGDATPAQTAAFLVGLRIKGETVAEMTGLVRTMLRMATPVPLEGPVIDTCGTGGDRSGTVNVSTMAALVAAGAGARVAKHGNRAASSQCGSADLLEALGVTIEQDPATVARCIEAAGIGFCFAQRYHPAMKHVGPVRRELGIPTVMNVLGPLSNPARPRAQVLGLYDPAMGQRMAEVLAVTGAERAMLVHGHDGLDELTTTGPSTVWELRDGAVRRFELDPQELGIRQAEPAAIKGGDPEANVQITRRVLDGEAGPARDVVVLNAAAALVVAGLADEMAAGIESAAASIDTGRAAAALDALVAASRPTSS